MDEGGLGLPDLELYYAAAQLQWPMKWLANTTGPENRLVRRGLGGKDTLSWLLGTSAPPRRASALIQVAWKCWKRYIQPRGAPPPYTPGLPLWSLPELAALLESHSAMPWRRASITRLEDVFEEGELMPFRRLQEKYKLGAQAFLAYGAICGVLQEIWSSGHSEPNAHMGLRAVLSHGSGRHAVTILYRALRGSHTDKHLAIKIRWDNDIVGNITDIQWETALAYVRCVSRNARLK